ncbi:MAG TPA: uroporphyrinogen-III C-methyltransferase, partial [Crenalkalicoccus sp.]|nr:uroporphyrinogen-III C-methyltransferase [Crenalkalicoccus sp.]
MDHGSALAAGDGPRPGEVWLVGAGPGDPGLLTLRAAEVLAAADVVLHDKLIPRAALDLVREGAEVVDVGKIGGGEQVPQEETTRLLVEHVRAGRQVVRLKGGDPFVFGRGGEEALALREAGLDYEVVPGVTAGIAASAYAGIPVTQRGMASAVAFVTGHEDPAKGAAGAPSSQVEWPALAAFPGTLVFYMGVRRLGLIAEQLVAGGRSPEEPAAVVEQGTLPGQRTVLATLGTIATAAADAGVRPPSITVVGPVAAL